MVARYVVLLCAALVMTANASEHLIELDPPQLPDIDISSVMCAAGLSTEALMTVAPYRQLHAFRDTPEFAEHGLQPSSPFCRRPPPSLPFAGAG